MSRNFSRILPVIAALLAAMAARHIGFHVGDPLNLFLSILRTAIYLTLFAAWGVSVRDRIIHPQIRRYIITVSVLMAFWVAVRGVRYALHERYWIQRHLWYLYYLPMLLIPLLALFISLSLGKPENYRLPGWTKLLFVPAAAMFVLVLTNDRHQLAFVFPEDAGIWLHEYTYSLVYYLVFGWIVICAFGALAIMLGKCRIPESRSTLVLPFVPAAGAVLYSVLYALVQSGVLRLRWMRLVAGDFTVVLCLLFVVILESCIRCGLIQTNTGYEELFMAGRLGAQITNAENEVCLYSANAHVLTREQRVCAAIHPVSDDKNTVIISHPVHFGHVLWQEDVTELSEAIEQIEENNRDLSERSLIRQKNLEARRKIIALQEKNRVTDLLNRSTAGQIRLIEKFLAQYDAETDDRKRRRLLADAAIVGAYIKRYGNLLLVAQQEETADITDLSRCFEDSFTNLEFLKVKCLCTFPEGIILSTDDMLDVYRTFESAVEVCMHDLRGIWINGREREENLILTMEFDCDADLSHLSSERCFFSCEDGSGRFTYILKKGKAKV